MLTIEPMSTKYKLFQTHVFMVFVSRSSPNCPPLKYGCPIKISNWIRLANLESALVGTATHTTCKPKHVSPNHMSSMLAWANIGFVAIAHMNQVMMYDNVLSGANIKWFMRLSLLNFGVKVSLFKSWWKVICKPCRCYRWRICDMSSHWVRLMWPTLCGCMPYLCMYYLSEHILFGTITWQNCLGVVNYTFANRSLLWMLVRGMLLRLYIYIYDLDHV